MPENGLITFADGVTLLEETNNDYETRPMPQSYSGPDAVSLLTRPEDFDVSLLAQTQDPYPLFAALHGAAKETATASGFHVVCSYELADQLLRDRRFLSGPIAEFYRQSLPPGAARDELAHRINFLDPPDHPRVQRLIMRAFTGRRVREMLPWVQAQTEKCLDVLEEQLAGGSDSIDLRAGLAHTLPSLVISEMLGVPLADRDMLTEWTEAVTPLLSTQINAAALERGLDAADKFAAYAGSLADERRKTPGEDLLTAMLHAEDGQETLSREELLSLIVTLYSAGHRTTLYVVRIPMTEADIAGTPIAPMTPILVLLAAANRDPAIFSDPDRFDIRRTGPDPLSFAVGPHRCLGAALAQMEAEVMLAAVTRRWQRLELVGEKPRWWSSGPFRGLAHLNVAPR